MTKSWHQHFKKSPKAARTFSGKTFDSKGEGKRFLILQQEQRERRISDLQRQVSYPLILPDGTPIKTPTGRTAKYKADFVYMEKGEQVIEDYKGYFAKDAQFKIAVFEAIYKVKVRISK